MEIEVVLNAGATIGESPTWASAEKALYWIDVKKPALYRYDPATATGGQREADVAELHSGMAWSPDGRLFYLSHSQRREVFAYVFDPENGRLGARDLFAKIPEPLGLPDGAAVDS